MAIVNLYLPKKYLVPLLVIAPCFSQSCLSSDWVIGDVAGEKVVIAAETVTNVTGNIIVVGDGELTVYGTLYLGGHFQLSGTGICTVSGGQLHLYGSPGNIGLLNSSRLCFESNALLNYIQSYYAQHCLVGYDHARIEFRDSRVSVGGSLEPIYLYSNAVYFATNLYHPDWKTWYLHDQTVLELHNVTNGGDIVFNFTGSSPTMTFENVNTLMPWLYFGSNAVVRAQFPTNSPVSICISNGAPGFTNIPWKLQMTNCSTVSWGIDPEPGSSVIISNSGLGQILFTFAGTATQSISGIMRNRTMYTNEVIPVSDRYLQLTNTYVLWWKVDASEACELHADNLLCGEMMGKQEARYFISNSICEGQTIHLGVISNAYIEFSNGQVWSFVSSWNNAALVLRDSLVDYRLGAYIYQTKNIAHDHSRMYWLNTSYGYQTNRWEAEPEATNGALVLFLKVDGFYEIEEKHKVHVVGSTWIKTGPTNPVTFDRYRLDLSPGGTSSWTLVVESTNTVREDLLGTINTTSLTNDAYRVRLTAWVNGDSTNMPTELYPAETNLDLAVTNLTTGPVDGDGDGMADVWEIEQFGSKIQDATTDYDVDGSLDLWEYVAGTQPTNAADFFRVGIRQSNAVCLVEVQARKAEGAGYDGRTRRLALDKTTNLVTGTWSCVPGYSNILCLGQSVVLTNQADLYILYCARVWLE